MSRIAVVTGAGSGIGKAAASALIDAGFKTVFAGRRLDVLHSAIKDIAATDENAVAVACDVSRDDDVDALFDSVETRFGRVDVLFNNAGLGLTSATIDELATDEWRKIIDVNLTGSFLCARRAFSLMRRQNPMGGRIINNGSISAHAPRPGSAPYTASKHAITGLTKTISLDGRPYNIACGQIDIGNADTDIAATIASGIEQANGEIAAEPLMDVRHVGAAVVQMATLPLSANVQFMTLMATNMPFVGRG